MGITSVCGVGFRLAGFYAVDAEGLLRKDLLLYVVVRVYPVSSFSGVVSYNAVGGPRAGTRPRQTVNLDL